MVLVSGTLMCVLNWNGNVCFQKFRIEVGSQAIDILVNVLRTDGYVVFVYFFHAIQYNWIVGWKCFFLGLVVASILHFWESVLWAINLDAIVYNLLQKWCRNRWLCLGNALQCYVQWTAWRWFDLLLYLNSKLKLTT